MNNSSSEFLQEINTYVGGVSKQKSVVAIVLTGSSGRDDFDLFSDIDNVVFVDGEHEVSEGKFTVGKFLFDTRIVDINKIIKLDWSDEMYFAYLNAKVIYDPQGIVKKIISEKKKSWNLSIVQKISLSLVNLSVIFKFEDNWKGLKSETHYNKFLNRKDYLSAQRLLSSGFEIILDIFYLINQTPIPDTKNKIRLLNKIRILPENIDVTLSQAFLVKSYTSEDLTRRYEILSVLVDTVKSSLEKAKIKLPDELYKYYLSVRK